MITCAHYRTALLAEPHAADAQLEQHRASCPECQAYSARLLQFDERLGRALRVDVPAAPARVAVLGASGVDAAGRRARDRPRRWFAMAASVLVVVALAGGLWLTAPHRSLAADVVAHMAGEPQAWTSGPVPVPATELDPVLAAAGMRLNPQSGPVSYAHSCLFRGHEVPHLVVQTEMGPVTVMVLEHEAVNGPKPFDEAGYVGVILPVPGHGSLAVLTRGPHADAAGLERIAARVRGAIHWDGPNG
jgi:hypothetical protein